MLQSWTFSDDCFGRDLRSLRWAWTLRASPVSSGNRTADQTRLPAQLGRTDSVEPPRSVGSRLCVTSTFLASQERAVCEDDGRAPVPGHCVRQQPLARL